MFIHPEDARARRLEGKKFVRVWNDRGAVVLPLAITDAVARGVVASEKGAWLATSRSGQTISALVSADDRADLANGACFNDSGVELIFIVRRGGTPFEITDIRALFGHNQRALELARLFVIDAEIGGKFHGGSDAFGHIDKRPIRKDSGIES